VGCGINYLQSFVERVLTQPRNLMIWLVLLALTAKIEVWRRQSVRQQRLEKRERAAAAQDLAHITPVQAISGPRKG